MSRLTLRRPNPKLSAAGQKGGAATLANHGREHYKTMGKTPAGEGKKRGRPSIDYVIGNDGLIYTGREAVALAQESKTEHNPGFSED